MMYSYLMLSTAQATGSTPETWKATNETGQPARTVLKMTCEQTHFWSRWGTIFAAKKNKYLPQFLHEIGSTYDDAIAAYMRLETPERRVRCRDAQKEVQPCTTLYSKATCQEVYNFFSHSKESNCQKLGEAGSLTKMQCKSPRYQVEVCSGDFYARETENAWVTHWYQGTHTRKYVCLEGWKFVDGREKDTFTEIAKAKDEVDCSNPACFHMSRSMRLEEARKSLVKLLENMQRADSLTTSGIGALTGIKVNVLSEEQKDLIKRLLSVLRDGKSVTVAVLQYVFVKASKIVRSVWGDIIAGLKEKWDNAKDTSGDIIAALTEDITDQLPDSDDWKEILKKKWDNAKDNAKEE